MAYDGGISPPGVNGLGPSLGGRSRSARTRSRADLAVAVDRTPRGRSEVPRPSPEDRGSPRRARSTDLAPNDRGPPHLAQCVLTVVTHGQPDLCRDAARRERPVPAARKLDLHWRMQPSHAASFVSQASTIGHRSAWSIQRGSDASKSHHSYGPNASKMLLYVTAWCIAASGSASSA